MRVVRSVNESTGGRFGHNEGAAMTKLVTEGKWTGQEGNRGKGKTDREKKKQSGVVYASRRKVRAAHLTGMSILKLCASAPSFDFAAPRLRSGRTGGGIVLRTDL